MCPPSILAGLDKLIRAKNGVQACAKRFSKESFLRLLIVHLRQVPPWRPE
jgi:hypothetical protein